MVDKLEQELAKVAAQINALTLSERQLRISDLRKGLGKEGVVLTAVDEEIIERFSQCACSFEDLVKHFMGRFP